MSRQENGWESAAGTRRPVDGGLLALQAHPKGLPKALSNKGVQTGAAAGAVKLCKSGKQTPLRGCACERECERVSESAPVRVRLCVAPWWWIFACILVKPDFHENWEKAAFRWEKRKRLVCKKMHQCEKQYVLLQKSMQNDRD